MDRRRLLHLAGIGGLAALPFGKKIYAGSRHRQKPLNIILLITDEQRAIQYWPQHWARRHLHSFRRLRRHGLNFTQAFTNACQCSPSRSVLASGKYAPVNGTTTTPGTLDASLPNLATILGVAGYQVFYKGKWHLTDDYVQPFQVSTDAEREQVLSHNAGLQSSYGFLGWNAPDAGTSISEMASLGGGVGGNDARFTSGQSVGPDALDIVSFLFNYSSQQPFCLMASLVNPHDVFAYPSFLAESGYEIEQFSGLPISLPPTFSRISRQSRRCRGRFSKP